MRVGLGFVRDWSEKTATAVVLERERRGPFASVGDLVRRAPAELKRTAIEQLVWVGGCDGFGLTRRELLWQVGLWLPPEAEHGTDARRRRQLELPLDHPHEGLRFGSLAAHERLLAEYTVLGFANSHPLSLLEGALPPGVVRSDALSGLGHGSWVEVAGLVVARQRPETAKGFVFVLMEDEAGMVNVIVRPDVYERYRTPIRGEPLLWVGGRLAKDDGTVNVLAEEARGLKLAFLKSMRRVAPESKDWG